MLVSPEPKEWPWAGRKSAWSCDTGDRPFYEAHPDNHWLTIPSRRAQVTPVGPANREVVHSPTSLLPLPLLNADPGFLEPASVGPVGNKTLVDSKPDVKPDAHHELGDEPSRNTEEPGKKGRAEMWLSLTLAQVQRNRPSVAVPSTAPTRSFCPELAGMRDSGGPAGGDPRAVGRKELRWS